MEAVRHPPPIKDGFRIAILSALSKEADMVQHILDRNWSAEGCQYPRALGDTNAYTTGLIGNHDVVIVHLPGMGNATAMQAAMGLKLSYPRIKVAFLVGICGASPTHPTTNEEVILGDLIIGKAVIQCDFGRHFTHGFERKHDLEDILGRPNTDTRAQISKLETPFNISRLEIHLKEYLHVLLRAKGIEYPRPEEDRLFPPEYPHKHNGPACDECIGTTCMKDCASVGCDTQLLVVRQRLIELACAPKIHVGRFGSSNSVIRSGTTRDQFARKDGIIGFEMEAAGMWDILPTVIAKSVCDYADGHKNKHFQSYSSAVAAAGLKAILEQWEIAEEIPPEVITDDPVDHDVEIPYYAPPLRSSRHASQSTMAEHDIAPLNSYKSSAAMPISLLTKPLSEMRGYHNLYKTPPQSTRKDRLEQLDTFLNTPRYEDSLARHISARQPGTCNWILENSVFQAWIDQDSTDTTKVLYVTAGAGAGKTVLCASIVERLKNEETPNLFYYFSSAHTKSNVKLDGIVRYWVSQIARRGQPASHSEDGLSLVEDLLDQPQKLGRAISAENLWIVFAKLVSRFANAIFVLDGLDEYPEGSRVELLQSLKKNLSAKAARVLLTCRNETDIKLKVLEDAPGINTLTYHIKNEDTQTDIDLVASNIVNRKLPKENDYIRTQLVSTLTRRCDGMFLWVDLASQRLVPGQSYKALTRAAESVPPGLNAVYQAKWNAILDCEESDRVRAISILTWCAFGDEPLTIAALAEALLVDLNDDLEEFDEDELPSTVNEDFIDYHVKRICGSLIEIRHLYAADDISGLTVHLVHSSVEDFLLTVLQQPPGECSIEQVRAAQQLKLSKISLKYLCYANVSIDRYRHDGSTWQFIGWALNWHLYRWASATEDPQFLELALRFMVHSPIFPHWAGIVRAKFPAPNILSGLPQALMATFARRLNTSPVYSNTPLYHAASCNLVSLMAKICSDSSVDLNAIGGKHGTALQAACALGQKEAFEFLLQKGANPWIRAGVLGSALNASVFWGHTEIAQRLLECEPIDKNATSPIPSGKQLDEALARTVSNVEFPPNTEQIKRHAYMKELKRQVQRNYDALSFAIFTGNVKGLRLLLDHGFDINYVDPHKVAHFHLACEFGDVVQVKMLIDAGADISALNSDGSDPLRGAIENGNAEVVKLLLRCGVPIKPVYWGSVGPLDIAAYFGHLEVIDALLEHDVEFQHSEDSVEALFYYAAVGGHHEVIPKLLSLGYGVCCGNSSGLVALHCAARKGDLEAFKCLLNCGLDPVEDFGHGRIVLLDAVSAGHMNIVKYLLEQKGVLLHLQHNSNVLCMAVAYGHSEICRILLDCGLDPEAKGPQGGTPLLVAAERGDIGILELLLNRGVDPMCRTPEGATSLHIVARLNHASCVKALLARKVNIDDAGGRDNGTPLHCAIRSRAKEVVEILIQHGANVNFLQDRECSSLYLAVESGDLEIVKLLLCYGVDATRGDVNGLTPVFLAATCGYVDIMKMLLEKDPSSIKTVDNDGHSMLSISCARGQVKSIKFLIQHYPELVSIKDKRGGTPLHHAAISGSLEAAKILLQDFSDLCCVSAIYGTLPIHLACLFRHLEIIKCLYQTAPSSVFQQREKGDACLHLAAMSGDVHVVEFLLTCGEVNVNLPANDGFTPLHHAVIFGDYQIIRLLLEHSASTSLRLKNGNTPLHCAVYSHDDVKIVEMLLKHGADVNAQTGEQNLSPLHVASAIGHTKVVEFLLEHGSNIKARNVDGGTPLHGAVVLNIPEVVEVLLEYDADVSAQMDTGHTPLDLAIGLGFIEVIEVLLQHGADIVARADDGTTYLHRAANCGNKEVIELLLKYGADVSVQSEGGWTPLHFAAYSGKAEAVEILLDHGADQLARTKNGFTPSIIAHAKGHAAIPTVLLLHGVE